MSVSILINTCDKYEKIWPVFFKEFQRFWPKCEYKVYLNTETKSYSCDGLDINPLNIRTDVREAAWSGRLEDALKRIDSEFIITILDDFIFEEQVDADELEKCVLRMEQDYSIGVVQFTCGKGTYGRCKNYPEWEEQMPGDKYRINCQAALWNKSYFLKLLRRFESPWEFEKYGSFRSRRYKEKVYAWASEENYVFTYNWGKPIIGGKWNLDEVERLENKLGIKFDLSGRECIRNYYETIKLKGKPKRDLRWCIKKISHIRSLI
ncbi:hypothetical protein [Congzhengia minquanensis]|uniref:Uncharacterized protein n=1 Tax=Congzhengia minquanensis TaxID=2763657 RepID=A0A926DJL0_9FIRM|nr:hypothetical protein [Congzhengia minquanensis]MBC8539416.1 hypothetical protein [Congzhengia minquanensis]